MLIRIMQLVKAVMDNVNLTYLGIGLVYVAYYFLALFLYTLGDIFIDYWFGEDE